MPRLTIRMLLATTLLLAVPANGQPSQSIAIIGATIFDGSGAKPYQGDVLVTNGRIAAVGPDIRVPAGARRVQARGKALLPGFFDVHSHWTPGGIPERTPQIATAYIQWGITTVNDFNQQPESFAPRREWIASLASPHVLFAARLSTPGGHGADWADQMTTIWVNTPDSARAAIGSLVPYKPDLIKIFTDGWRYGMMPNNTSMNEDTVKAAVEAAHGQNWPVLTHTVTVERGLEAARAGVDSLAHGMQDRRITPEEVLEIKQSGMAMAPTLAVYEPNKPGTPPRDPADLRTAQAMAKFQNALFNVKALHDAGIPIALGTDAGMPGTPHGKSSLREMELLVQAGLTPSEALVAGTSVSAKLMRIDQDRGTIAVGKRADIILIDGKPWETISDVYKLSQVYIDGRLVSGRDAPALPAANRADRLPSTTVGPLIDDFERPDGRSALDTLRLETPDGGPDRSVEITQIVPRENGHALRLSARLANKPDPFVSAAIPLTRGSVRPADLGRYKGVRFEIRGAGRFAMVMNGLDGSWSAPLQASDAWQAVEVPFSSLAPVITARMKSPAWNTDGLVQVEINGTGASGSRIWMEIDNVRFY
ncbi:amidohydrolase family protein [Sphingobium sp. H39-3-25]|uniref:amidohydrolase family protein n=1 Tax=Sphingobium arseniciresistens TaxID=3030834 RepID=UPI0023BA3358|nr:amidohydrolase family protein [Sphingobium arseniciresistens]